MGAFGRRQVPLTAILPAGITPVGKETCAMTTLPITRYTAPFNTSAAIIAAELQRLRTACCEAHDFNETAPRESSLARGQHRRPNPSGVSAVLLPEVRP